MNIRAVILLSSVLLASACASSGMSGGGRVELSPTPSMAARMRQNADILADRTLLAETYARLCGGHPDAIQTQLDEDHLALLLALDLVSQDQVVERTVQRREQLARMEAVQPDRRAFCADLRNLPVAAGGWLTSGRP